MKPRILIFYSLLLLGLLVLVVRLFMLQVLLGKKNLALSEGNRVRKEAVKAPRGIIYDETNKPLVRNVPVYYSLKENCQETDKECYEVISREEAMNIRAGGTQTTADLKVGVGRDYLYGPALAHVLGYLNWDFRGVAGIEESYDGLLAGRDGGEIFEVDTRGLRIREIETVKPQVGHDLHLTVNAELSQAALAALEGRNGAVVATGIDGRVLILVSSPSFDPNLFVDPESKEAEKLTAILQDPQKSMFNRAIGGVYPPGSTFKIVSAVAGLEEGKIKGDTLIEDTGVIKIGPYSYSNWYFTRYGKTEGKINIVRAITRSTDTFFYKLGEELGAESLSAWAKAFKLGRLTGIDIGSEAEGLIPDPDWKEKTIGEPWFLGNTYHMAIGQGDLLLTPLQVNMLMGIIADNGQICTPHLVQKENQCQDMQLKPETLALVQEGLKGACSSGGTAGIFFDFEPKVACKTGTAEFGPIKASGFRDTHAWFTAYAPADRPEIVITALVEGGGEGSEVAAPIVKKVLQAWFKQD